MQLKKLSREEIKEIKEIKIKIRIMDAMDTMLTHLNRRIVAKANRQIQTSRTDKSPTLKEKRLARASIWAIASELIRTERTNVRCQRSTLMNILNKNQKN